MSDSMEALADRLRKRADFIAVPSHSTRADLRRAAAILDTLADLIGDQSDE
jgi:hypothetical protein